LQSSEYLPMVTLGELLDLFGSWDQYVAQAHGLPPGKSNKNHKAGHPFGYAQGGPEQDRRGHGPALQLVGLENKEHEYVKNLSGGQKQRFTIATSLVNDPEILFLDEPTTGLDPAARRSLWQLIKQINSRGVTIVMTTHYMEEAEFLCNRVAIMDKGQILQIDEPHKLIDKLSETTQVSFFTDRDIDKNIFVHIPEITKTYSHYPKITLELSNLDKISQIIKILKDHSIPFSGFMVKTASLEDVYLDLTGHEYEA
jgi:ABC-2 type transport system ATP-binding protein